MNRSRRFVALAAVFVSAFIAGAETVRAEVQMTFYAHSGTRIRGGWLYFPHAYIGLTGVLETGDAVESYIGFTASNPGPHLLLTSGRRLVSTPDERYRHESRQGLSVTITDETYWLIQDRVNIWRSPTGSTYNLHRRNCITFVADLAEAAGLTPPEELTLSPGRFLDDLGRLNLDVNNGMQLQALRPPPPPSNP